MVDERWINGYASNTTSQRYNIVGYDLKMMTWGIICKKTGGCTTHPPAEKWLFFLGEATDDGHGFGDGHFATQVHIGE